VLYLYFAAHDSYVLTGPNGEHIYSLRYLFNVSTVSIISRDSNDNFLVEGNANVNGEYDGIAINGNNNFIYLTSERTGTNVGTLAIMAVPSGQVVVQPIPIFTGGYPDAITMAPSGNNLYAAVSLPDTFSLLDFDMKGHWD